MPVVSRGVCETCGNLFFLSEEQMKVLPTMRINNINNRIGIRTWGDWIKYIGIHCPQCRYPIPSLQVTEDLEYHINIRNYEVPEEEEKSQNVTNFIRPNEKIRR